MPALPTHSPIDPGRHRAIIASAFASLPPELQIDALAIVAHWPRHIHFLAHAGELAPPREFALLAPSAAEKAA